ncbi:MAG: hypothetical protein V3T08_10055 [Gemmatimonadota bacterium]
MQGREKVQVSVLFFLLAILAVLMVAPPVFANDDSDYEDCPGNSCNAQGNSESYAEAYAEAYADAYARATVGDTSGVGSVTIGGDDINIDPAAAQALAVAGNFCSGASAGVQGIGFGGSFSLSSSDCILLSVATIYLGADRSDLAKPLLDRIVDRATRHDWWLKRWVIDRINPLKLIFD